MPRCKNNPNRSYKGIEPSPKGRGFCASGAKVHEKMKGKDGNIWKVMKFGKVQRWVKCVTKKSIKPKKMKSKSKSKTLNFRMVIGYFKHTDFYDDMLDTDDKRPYATKSALKKLFNQQRVWNNFYMDSEFPLFDGSGKDVEAYTVRPGKIRPINIKNIKITTLKHHPTVWEKFTKKYRSWWYNPEFVVVVDLMNVPTIPVTQKQASDFMNRQVNMTNKINDEFYDDLLKSFNHQSISANGWINHYKQVRRNGRWIDVQEDPFKGDLSLLQCGPIATTIPDYRKFHV